LRVLVVGNNAKADFAGNSGKKFKQREQIRA